MEFEGYDWTELTKYFGILYDENDDNDDNDEALKETKKYLSTILIDELKTKETASIIRCFLEKLYCNSIKLKANGPIWKGMAEISDNLTLIKYTIVLLEYMWY